MKFEEFKKTITEGPQELEAFIERYFHFPNLMMRKALMEEVSSYCLIDFPQSPGLKKADPILKNLSFVISLTKYALPEIEIDDLYYFDQETNSRALNIEIAINYYDLCIETELVETILNRCNARGIYILSDLEEFITAELYAYNSIEAIVNNKLGALLSRLPDNLDFTNFITMLPEQLNKLTPENRALIESAMKHTTDSKVIDIAAAQVKKANKKPHK